MDVWGLVCLSVLITFSVEKILSTRPLENGKLNKTWQIRRLFGHLLESGEVCYTRLSDSIPWDVPSCMVDNFSSISSWRDDKFNPFILKRSSEFWGDSLYCWLNSIQIVFFTVITVWHTSVSTAWLNLSPLSINEKQNTSNSFTSHHSSLSLIF